MTAIAPETGWYLAGLTDGEGCFAIGIRNGRRATIGWACSFVIRMRDDETALLETLARDIGLGRIDHTRNLPDHGRDNKPSVRWHVSGKHECLALVDVFTEYPPRGKKAREFKLWAEAVRYWCSPQSLPLPLGDKRRRGRVSVIDWRPVEHLAAELRRLRAYPATPLFNATAPVSVRNPERMESSSMREPKRDYLRSGVLRYSKGLECNDRRADDPVANRKVALGSHPRGYEQRNASLSGRDTTGSDTRDAAIRARHSDAEALAFVRQARSALTLLRSPRLQARAGLVANGGGAA